MPRRHAESQPEAADPSPPKSQRLTRSSAIVAEDVQNVSSGSEEPSGEDSRDPALEPEESDDDVEEVPASSFSDPRSPSLQSQRSPSPDQSRDEPSAVDEDAPAEFAGLDASTRINCARHTYDQIEFIKKLRRRKKLLERLEQKQATREKRDDRRATDLQRQNSSLLANHRDHTLSITVEWQGHHVPQEVFDTLRQFLEQSSSWWCLSKEKGATIGLWHCQAVAKFHTTSPKAVKKDWIRFAGWHVNPPPYKVNNCFKEVSNRGLSTQHGLLGYVRKDIDQYEGHICVSSESVRDEEKVRGDELYLAFGKSDKTSDCILTPSNFIDRASLFFDRRIRNPALAQLDYVFKSMLQTGKFSIHGSFFTHHGSMIYSRAQTAFQCRVFPGQTSTEDVHAILFNRRNVRDETVDNTTPEPVDRDGPDDLDPFEAQSAYVTLDRSFHADAAAAGQFDSRDQPLSECDTTEARSNADARPPPSMYETLRSFATDTDSCTDATPLSDIAQPPSATRQTDYSETAWDIAGDVTRRVPTPQQLLDPRMPEFFVHRSPAPGLDRPVYSRYSSSTATPQTSSPPSNIRPSSSSRRSSSSRPSSSSTTGDSQSSRTSAYSSTRRRPRPVPQSDSEPE